MTVHQRIEMRPDVMLGKPVRRGTRITVELVLRKLAEGITVDDLLDAYPRLTGEDVRAAIRFAADSLAHEEVVFRPTGTERCRTRHVRFLADESCDFAVVRARRAAGHDVTFLPRWTTGGSLSAARLAHGLPVNLPAISTRSRVTPICSSRSTVCH